MIMENQNLQHDPIQPQPQAVDPQINQAPPSTVPPSVPLPPKKKVSFLSILVLIFLLFAIVFCPIPQFSKEMSMCKVYDINCIKENFSFGNSLFKEIFQGNTISENIEKQTPTPETEELPSYTFFKDETNGYYFKFPKEFNLLYVDDIPTLNYKINWSVNEVSYKDCTEECPSFEKSESIDLGIHTFTKLYGTLDSSDGGIPESFVAYEIKFPQENKYFFLTLHEIVQETSVIEALSLERTPEEISNSEILAVEEILKSFNFANLNTSEASTCMEQKECEEGILCMTNPASSFCTCMGGENEIIKDEEGNESGLCFVSGNKIDEWEYYRLFSEE